MSYKKKWSKHSTTQRHGLTKDISFFLNLSIQHDCAQSGLVRKNPFMLNQPTMAREIKMCVIPLESI